MASNAVVGLKPDVQARQLIELVTSVVRPPDTIHLVSLVHVGTDDDERDRVEVARTETDRIAERLRGDGYAVETVVQVAAVALGADLARIADNLDADLVVIGLGKRSRVGKALLGSDAQTVLLSATCPVLAVRLA